MPDDGPPEAKTRRPASALPGLPFAEQPALQLIYDTAPIGLAFLSPDCRYVYPDSLRRRKIACLTMADGFCSMHDSGRVSFARGSSRLDRVGA